jgi:hypothetical protein
VITSNWPVPPEELGTAEARVTVPLARSLLPAPDDVSIDPPVDVLLAPAVNAILPPKLSDEDPADILTAPLAPSVETPEASEIPPELLLESPLATITSPDSVTPTADATATAPDEDTLPPPIMDTLPPSEASPVPPVTVIDPPSDSSAVPAAISIPPPFKLFVPTPAAIEILPPTAALLLPANKLTGPALPIPALPVLARILPELPLDDTPVRRRMLEVPVPMSDFDTFKPIEPLRVPPPDLIEMSPPTVSVARPALISTLPPETSELPLLNDICDVPSVAMASPVVTRIWPLSLEADSPLANLMPPLSGAEADATEIRPELTDWPEITASEPPVASEDLPAVKVIGPEAPAPAWSPVDTTRPGVPAAVPTDNKTPPELELEASPEARNTSPEALLALAE